MALSAVRIAIYSWKAITIERLALISCSLLCHVE